MRKITRYSSPQKGTTLIDTLVGIGLMMLVFVGIYGAFQLTVDVVTNNKAQAGATALSDQRMEYVRSLTYAAVGTVGGIPSGLIPQSENTSLNGIQYVRRTYIEYDDDPKDGTGAADSNSIVEDYKLAKVQVSWTLHGKTRSVVLVARVSPAAGLESNVPGGTLAIFAVNSVGVPIAGAGVSIVNAAASPAVNINTFTDASGTATILGAPSASGYQVTVSDPGYSTSQTYSTTAQNTNPNPANLTVTNARTTSATFAIDVLGTKVINTWTQILAGTSSDPFNDMSLIATSTGITVSAGAASLSSTSTSGEIQSVPFSPTTLATWGKFTWSDSQPASTSIRYRVYNAAGTALIPDAYIPGNAAGVVSGSINLTGVPTSTYPSVRLDAVFSRVSTNTTPTLTLWNVSDTYGPLPIANVAFTLIGAKTIGSGPSGTLYKYGTNQTTGSFSSATITNLEWDNYIVAISGTSTGYDIASACNPQPESLSPGATMTSNFYLIAHTTNSLLVDVRSASTGGLIPGATVTLTNSGYASTATADSCGQAFFANINASPSYSISVAATGHTTYTSSTVNVAGTSRLSVVLN